MTIIISYFDKTLSRYVETFLYKNIFALFKTLRVINLLNREKTKL